MNRNEHTDRIVARYQAGATMQAIADDLGIAPKVIRNRLQSAGVQTRRPGPAA